MNLDWSETALLAPVPHSHLESGASVFERQGLVAFGSASAEAMATAPVLAETARLRILFYASHAPDAFPPRVTWCGTFARLEAPKAGKHPKHDLLRPPTTDDDSAWLIFYEVEAFQRLTADEQIPLSKLKRRGGRALSKAFIPLGPILIENPL